MNKYEKMLIDHKLKTRCNLKCNSLYEKDYNEAIKIINMAEWQDEHFKHLLNPLIWNHSYSDIKKILHLKYWKNPKFAHLLTPNIWRSNIKNIREILSMKEWKEPKYQHLLTDDIWRGSAKNIQNILSMEEWENPRFKPLLTPGIFRFGYENIKSKLNLPILSEPKYSKLLTRFIFTVSAESIVKGIKLFEKYNLSDYVTCARLKGNLKRTEILINYLIDNNRPLLFRVKKTGLCELHPVFSATNKVLLEKYNIDIDAITGEYEKKLVITK